MCTTSGVMINYKFSYDNEAYYLKWRKGNGSSYTLMLPVCRQTLELIKKYRDQDNLQGLAKRLKLDKKGRPCIKDFNPPKVHIKDINACQNYHKHPMLQKLTQPNHYKSQLSIKAAALV